MKQIRVLMAHHHALIRGGICALLEKLPELQIVAEASDGPDEALRLIWQHQPDVALVGSAMSKLNGFEVTARVRKESPEVRVIILSAHVDEEGLRQALDCGAAGYLVMTASTAELELAVKSVANGETHLSPSLKEASEESARWRAVDEAYERLTPRQREVLKLIAG